MMGMSSLPSSGSPRKLKLTPSTARNMGSMTDLNSSRRSCTFPLESSLLFSRLPCAQPGHAIWQSEVVSILRYGGKLLGRVTFNLSSTTFSNMLQTFAAVMYGARLIMCRNMYSARVICRNCLFSSTKGIPEPQLLHYANMVNVATICGSEVCRADCLD